MTLFGDIGLGVDSTTEQTLTANMPSIGERYIKGICYRFGHDLLIYKLNAFAAYTSEGSFGVGCA